MQIRIRMLTFAERIYAISRNKKWGMQKGCRNMFRHSAYAHTQRGAFCFSATQNTARCVCR